MRNKVCSITEPLCRCRPQHPLTKTEFEAALPNTNPVLQRAIQVRAN